MQSLTRMLVGKMALPNCLSANINTLEIGVSYCLQEMVFIHYFQSAFCIPWRKLLHTSPGVHLPVDHTHVFSKNNFVLIRYQSRASNASTPMFFW
jgi:hypothetical protein